MSYLDNAGLTYFWGKLKAILNNKSDINHTHSDLEARISALESAMQNKQDKIDNWNDLKGE